LIFRRAEEARTDGRGVFSVPSFTDLGLAPDLVDALSARGVTAPFPIQAATIPDALEGRDICGRAPTGSGKTIAFGLPIVERVQPARPRRPSCLILAPTPSRGRTSAAGRRRDPARPSPSGCPSSSGSSPPDRADPAA